MDKNKTMVIMSAIARSGKSTYVNTLRKMGYLVVSADDLRTTLLGEKGNMNNESLIWEVFYSNLKTICSKGYNVIIDNTNISRKARKTLIDIAKIYDYKVNCVRVKTKMDTIIKRCAETCFPVKVIHDMDERYQEPSYDEGFDVIIDIKGE